MPIVAVVVRAGRVGLWTDAWDALWSGDTVRLPPCARRPSGIMPLMMSVG